MKNEFPKAHVQSSRRTVRDRKGAQWMHEKPKNRISRTRNHQHSKPRRDAGCTKSLKRSPHRAPRPRQEHSKSIRRASRLSRELRKSTRGASRQRRKHSDSTEKIRTDSGHLTDASSPEQLRPDASSSEQLRTDANSPVQMRVAPHRCE